MRRSVLFLNLDNGKLGHEWMILFWELRIQAYNKYRTWRYLRRIHNIITAPHIIFRIFSKHCSESMGSIKKKKKREEEQDVINDPIRIIENYGFDNMSLINSVCHLLSTWTLWSVREYYIQHGLYQRLQKLSVIFNYFTHRPIPPSVLWFYYYYYYYYYFYYCYYILIQNMILTSSLNKTNKYKVF